MNAHIYCRFSERPNSESKSNEMQLAICLEYCKDKGYKVAGSYSDAMKSGADPARPGLANALHAMKKGDVLVAWKHDRLARDAYISEVINRQVAKKKGRVECVTGGCNGNSPEQVLLRQFLASFAEYERKLISARTSASMKHHQAAGRRMGCKEKTPYGTKADGAMLIPDAHELEAIALAKKLRTKGLTLRDIAAVLEEQGYKPKGKQWYPSSIKKLLIKT